MILFLLLLDFLSISLLHYYYNIIFIVCLLADCTNVQWFFCAFCQKILSYRPTKMRKNFSIWWVSKCEFLVPYGGIFPVYVISSAGIFWKWLGGRIFQPDYGNFFQCQIFPFFHLIFLLFLIISQNHRIVNIGILHKFLSVFCAIFLGVVSIIADSHF